MTDAFFTWGWLVIGLAAAVLEVAALIRRRPGDTLSEKTWAWLEGKPLRAFLLTAFLLWLLAHFLTGGRWG